MSSFIIIEELAGFHDSRTSTPIVSAMSLAVGEAYSITAVGNVDVHNRGNTAGPAIVYPSPGAGGTGAEQNGYSFLHFSLDGGSTYTRFSEAGALPPTTDPNVHEVWVPIVIGEGHPLYVRNFDSPISDNSGMFKIYIGPPRNSGWKIGEVGLG